MNFKILLETDNNTFFDTVKNTKKVDKAIALYNTVNEIKEIKVYQQVNGDLYELTLNMKKKNPMGFVKK